MKKKRLYFILQQANLGLLSPLYHLHGVGCILVRIIWLTQGDLK